MVAGRTAGADLRTATLEPETAELRGAIVTIEQAVLIAEALGLDIRADRE